MGSKPSIVEVEHANSQSAYSNRHQFVPLFTTHTLTGVCGFVRLSFNNNIPQDLIDIIYKYIKNNCTFIIIFENTKQPQHSYLHEIDVESGTNINLSEKYNHFNNIWERIPGASYCYGQYNSRETIFRIGGSEHKSIRFTLKTGKIFKLPPLEICYSQCIYSKNHGLYMLGGCSPMNFNHSVPYVIDPAIQASNNVFNFNETTNKWDHNTMNMIEGRYAHLSVFYESHHSNISDKIFCLGGCDSNANKKSVEYYDFKNGIWQKSTRGMMYERKLFGGCIDFETDKLVIAGGTVIGASKIVTEYDFDKNRWYRIGYHTNFQHVFYPKVTKHNKVIVVFGNSGYKEGGKDFGYVEYLDKRSNNKKWIVLSSFREMLEFSGSQVKNGFYQHMVQM